MLSRLQARSNRQETLPPTTIGSIKDAYESGQSTEEEFISTIIRETGFEGEQEECVRIWCEIFTENEQMTGLIRALADQGHHLYLLSNTNRLHLDYLQRTYPAFGYFSGGIYSHEVGAMKPDEKIYRAALEQFSLNAKETLYIDDLPENINTGKQLKLKCHQYLSHSHHELIAWLSAEGISMP